MAEDTKKKNVAEEGQVYRLSAPDKVKGTNWHERFYNEIAKVEDRVATVKRPGNRDDLLRRGWKIVDGEGSGSEEDNANKARELEGRAKLFIEGFAKSIEEAKGLPESDELASAIEASEKALEDKVSERDMSIACRAMTAIMDKVKAAGTPEGDGPAPEAEAEKPGAEEETTEEVDPPPSEDPKTEEPKGDADGADAPAEEKKKGMLGKLKDKLTGKSGADKADEKEDGAEGAPGEKDKDKE